MSLLNLITTRFDLKIIRTAMVGLLASAGSLGVLTILIQVCHLPPTEANIPSLATGTAIQFLGNRYFAFRSTQNSAVFQLLGFLVSEAIAFGMNVYLFNFLVESLGAHFLVARLLGTFIVFILFSFPTWCFLVFRSFRLNTAK
jgi:putative flippase GtrA